MKTIPHPTAVFVRRNDRPNFTRPIDGLSDNRFSARLPVNVDVDASPFPVQSTSFAGVGKGPNHGTPFVWRFQSLNIRAIHAIMAPNFIMGKGDPAEIHKGMPRGTFQPLVERTNIDRPNQTTQGQRVETQPDLVMSPAYIKLV